MPVRAPGPGWLVTVTFEASEGAAAEAAACGGGSDAGAAAEAAIVAEAAHAAKAWFEAKGARVLGEPRIGAHGTLIFFVHPKDMNGVLTEIMETPKEAH